MSSSSANSTPPASRVFGALILCLLVGSPAGLATTSQGETQLRTVRGIVVNSSDVPLPSAVVYLKNLKTLAIRTYISSSNGQFRFSGLDPNVDYQIHAELRGLTSATHTISSFDSRRDVVIQLKINRKKAGK